MADVSTQYYCAARGGADASLSQRLAHGLEAMQIEVSEPAQRSLLSYLALLAQWNRVYNLTAVRDPLQMVTRHLLDSLAILPEVVGTRLLDLGTGAGLPGIPLALVRPELDVVLLDSNRKKTRFLTQAVTELELENVTVVTARVEDYRPQRLFDTVVSRAYSDLVEMAAAGERLLRPEGVVLAMKGEYPMAELSALNGQIQAPLPVVSVLRQEVPGLDAQRHLVILRRGRG